MTRTTNTAPASVRLARWYLAAVGALLLGVSLVTVASHVALAAQGVTLVFSQEQMDDVAGAIEPAPADGAGPGAAPDPVPAEEAVGGVQYVDVAAIGLTMLGGALAAAGALMLLRRSRWSVALGLAAVAVTAAVGLLPAWIGIWAMNFYAEVDLGQAIPFLVVSGVLVALSLACAVAIWRHRVLLGPA